MNFLKKAIDYLKDLCECGGKYFWDTYHDVCSNCGKKQ
jgi:hypothetical protein